jgi:NADPH2:quinone reductase
MPRAIYIRRHGEPEELEVGDYVAPSPGSGEITIETHVAGVNYPDLLVVRGLYQNLAPLPFVPGKEIAGCVSGVGPGVSEFRIGERVICYQEDGGYAEQVTVPADLCHPIPDTIDLVDAVAFGIGYQTAHFALMTRAQFKPGETVLVTGATGVVGLSTIGLAKACGAFVIAGCTTATKVPLARRHGADHVMMLDGSDLASRLRDEVNVLTQGHGVDIVIETLGGSILEASIRTLAWCGRLVVVGFAAQAPALIRSNYLLIKNITATGLHWSDYRDRTPSLVRETQAGIYRLAEAGRITSPIAQASRFDEAALALRAVADRRVFGKTVLLTDGYRGGFRP